MDKKPQIIIDNIQVLLDELRLSLGVDHNDSAKPVLSKPAGLTGDLHSLINEGFFDQPRTLSEIQEKLRVEGINKPVTSLMKPLIYLIKKKVLKRDRPEKGQFQYQRR